MKKMSIYYVCHLILNTVLLLVFSSHIQLHILSLIPLFLILLMIFQITLFKSFSKNDNVGDTAYSVGDTVRLTEEEQACQYSYLKHSFLLFIPFEVPFVFFFSSFWKFLGIVPYILAYVVGGIFFRAAKGREIKNRIKSEEKELQEQKKREELGF